MIAHTPIVVPASQPLAALTRPHAIFARPARSARTARGISPWRPITGERTLLPLLGTRRGAHGGTWLRVRLPGRPNSHTGWITSNGTFRTQTTWRLLVETSRHRVTVFHHGRRVRSFLIVVGKRSTPTPHGRFFVEETVKLGRWTSGAPFALALSARSNVLQEFDGGPGQIALHGLVGVGGVPGTSASHGCLRMYARSIGWLAARIGPGVPVTITGRRK